MPRSGWPTSGLASFLRRGYLSKAALKEISEIAKHSRCWREARGERNVIVSQGVGANDIFILPLKETAMQPISAEFVAFKRVALELPAGFRAYAGESTSSMIGPPHAARCWVATHRMGLSGDQPLGLGRT